MESSYLFFVLLLQPLNYVGRLCLYRRSGIIRNVGGGRLVAPDDGG